MLALPENGDKINKDALALEFSSLSIVEKTFLMKDWLISLEQVESNLPLGSLLFKDSIREVITMIFLDLGYSDATSMDASILSFLLRL
jgi:hypothetical protein